MIDTKPKPLINPSVDLTDFPFMPVLIARLKQSRAWLVCKRRPELAFYMLNLWTACWHGKPAGSLEDDDLVLADLAMCGTEKVWTKIKDEVLRGWVRCSDGRIYHPVVAEQAMEAWTRKTARRAQTEAARVAREASKAAAEARRLSRLPGETESVTPPVTDNETKNVSRSKREGQGQGQGEGQEKAAAMRASASRSVLEVECRALVGEEPVLLAQDFHVLETLLDDGITADDLRTGIREALAKRADPKRRFRSWSSFANWCRTAAQNRMAAAPARPSAKATDATGPTFDFGAGFTPTHKLIRSVWGRGEWLPDWGPRPGEDGCRIPAELLDEIMGQVPA